MCTLNYTYLHGIEFVVSAVAQAAKLSVKCPLRGTNGASAYRKKKKGFAGQI